MFPRKAVETRTKKRRAKQKGTGKRKVEMRVVRACKIHRETPRKRLLREKATPSSTIHINRYQTLFTYIYAHTKNTYRHTHIYIYICAQLARARSPASFSEHPNGHLSGRFPSSLAVICSTWFDIVMQIQPGISLIRRAPRSHVCTCARRIYNISFFASHLPLAAPIKLILSYVDHSRDRYMCTV